MTEPDLTADDQFVERTDNSLRPEDENLEQPSQDPSVIPESIVDDAGREVVK